LNATGVMVTGTPVNTTPIADLDPNDLPEVRTMVRFAAGPKIPCCRQARPPPTPRSSRRQQAVACLSVFVSFFSDTYQGDFAMAEKPAAKNRKEEIDKSRCVQCGKGTPNAQGTCPLCGGLTDEASGLFTEIEGIEGYNARMDSETQTRKNAGEKCISVEIDYLTDQEYDVIANVFRRVARIAGQDYDKAEDHYWAIRCFLAIEP